MAIYNFMAYLSNLVHKNHHVCLKNLSCIREISDVTETINPHYFLTWNDDIDKTRVFDNLANDLRACLPESDSQQSSDFNDEIL